MSKHDTKTTGMLLAWLLILLLGSGLASAERVFLDPQDLPDRFGAVRTDALTATLAEETTTAYNLQARKKKVWPDARKPQNLPDNGKGPSPPKDMEYPMHVDLGPHQYGDYRKSEQSS